MAFGREYNIGDIINLNEMIDFGTGIYVVSNTKSWKKYYGEGSIKLSGEVELSPFSVPRLGNMFGGYYCSLLISPACPVCDTSGNPTSESASYFIIENEEITSGYPVGLRIINGSNTAFDPYVLELVFDGRGTERLIMCR